MSGFPPQARPQGADLSLGPSDIHLWSIALDQPPHQVAALRALLAPDEIERADRFRFERHRRQYTVGRGVLRQMLGRYLGRRPEELSFSYGDKGKPYLPAHPGLYFNLSNSEELALVGLTRRGEIGVDVEHLRPMPDGEQIAERFFSVPERDVLRAVPGPLKDVAFFNCWTRKEAYIKAVGDGLSMALDRFDVTLAPGEPARMLRLDGDEARGAEWYLAHFEPKDGYVGALAIVGREFDLVCREWLVG